MVEMFLTNAPRVQGLEMKMKTYNEIYQEIRSTEMKVLTGTATDEEASKYREFLESDIYKEQIKKDLDSMPSVWDKCNTSHAVAISG